jgi:integrase
MARERLSVAGVSLCEAVEFYLRHSRAVREVVRVPMMVERFLRSREDEGRSERYVRQLRVSLGAFGRAFALADAGAVTREEVQGWLRSGGWAAKTRNNYLGDVAAMYGWGMREGLAARSPCEGVERAVLREGEITTLGAAEARVLLEAARGDGELMGYVVLALFCGLRSAELERLETGSINLAEGTVIVLGMTAKTGQRRVVDIPGNALAWLGTVTLPVGRLCGGQWAERWRTFRRGCGWSTGKEKVRGYSAAFRAVCERVPVTRGEWPANVLRHTYASMHYAEWQDEALLKAQMGHWERADTLHRHYRALRTRGEAREFWGLRP